MGSLETLESLEVLDLLNSDSPKEIPQKEFQSDLIYSITDVTDTMNVTDASNIPLFKYTIVQSINSDIFLMSGNTMKKYIKDNNISDEYSTIIRRIHRKRRNCVYARNARLKRKKRCPKH